MSADYESIPLTGLRKDLGKVVTDVADNGRPVIVTRDGQEAVALVPVELLRAGGLLPPAYLDDAERRAEIARLDAELAAESPEAKADADAWLQRLNATSPGGSAAGAA